MEEMEGDSARKAKLSAKQALKQKQEIMSESCRRLRETQFSLPYHKPKQRSLKEFLEKRPKFAEILPENALKKPVSLAIKMTQAEIMEMTKKLEEREKLLKEEFYKSESEDSEAEDKENDPDYKDIHENDSCSDKSQSDVDEKEEGDETIDDQNKSDEKTIEGTSEITENENGQVGHDLNKIDDNSQTNDDKLKIPSDNDKENIQACNDNVNFNDKLETNEELNKNDSNFGKNEKETNESHFETTEESLKLIDSDDETMDDNNKVIIDNNKTVNDNNITVIDNINKTNETLTDNFNKTVDNITIENNGQLNNDKVGLIVLQNINLTDDSSKTNEMEVENKSGVDSFDKTKDKNDSLISNFIENYSKTKDNEKLYVTKNNDIIKTKEDDFNKTKDGVFNKTKDELFIKTKDGDFNKTKDSDLIQTKDDELSETKEELNTSKANLEQMLNKFDFPSENDSQFKTNEENILNFDSQESVEEVPTEKKLTKAEILKEKLKNIQPKLSGRPGEKIDLEEDISKPTAVQLMIERFLKHNSKSEPVHKDKVYFNVHNVEADKVYIERVAATVDEDDIKVDLNEKPGSKLLKLKHDLQEQIIQKKTEIWEQKTKEKQEMTEVDKTYQGEKESCGDDPEDILDLLDEEEMEVDSSASSDDELEDDCELIEKKKPKSAFVQDEAEEDDFDNDDEAMEGEDGGEGEVEEDDEGVGEDCTSQNGEDIHGKLDENEEGDVLTSPVGKKKFSRIVFEDSDEDDEKESNLEEKNKMATSKISEGINFDSRGSWDDDEILPPNRPMNSQTPIRHLTQARPDLSFLTPVNRLTGLQVHNSASKYLESPSMSPFLPQSEPSPLRNLQKNLQKNSLQKNLFCQNESQENQNQPNKNNNSTVDDQNGDNLTVEGRNGNDLTAGSQNGDNLTNDNQNDDFLTVGNQNGDEKQKSVEIEPVNTQEIFEICSGNFLSLTDEIKSQNDKNKTNLDTNKYKNDNINEKNANFNNKNYDFNNGKADNKLFNLNDSVNEKLDDNNKLVNIEINQVNTQDLTDICSGNFETQANKNSNLQTQNLGSESFKSTQNEQNSNQKNDQKTIYLTPGFSSDVSDGKNMVFDDDKLISQLLDEEEVENYRRKMDFDENVVGKSRIIYDSDEENNMEEIGKKRVAKFIDSDDSDSDQEEEQEEEVIDLHIPSSDDEDEHGIIDETDGNNMENDVQEVDYDSEENEIDPSDKISENNQMKIKDFLENEAELSESEWGSEDEDEKGLNEFEEELGDKEKFDERKLQRDLEKIHMRQILDEDQREVKILQELLLEDGELHGQGRQRQFKWKNVDNMPEDAEKQANNDDFVYDDEENEFEWRKKRHERETFLKSQEGRKLVETSMESQNLSQIFKLSEKSIISNINLKNVSSKKIAASPEIKLPFMTSLKRNSLLERSDNVLERLAKYSAKEDEKEIPNSASNSASRNFVFQSVKTVQAPKFNTSLDKKRKAIEGTPKVLKKMKLTTNFSPAVKKSKK